MLAFIMQYIAIILAVAVGGAVLISFIIANAPNEYPENEAGYIHVGLLPGQLKTLAPVIAELPFFSKVQKQSESNGAIYHAFTEPEFLSFYAELVRQGRVVIAEQALRKAAFLPPDALTFAQLIAELRPYRDRLTSDPADYDSRQYYGEPTPLDPLPRS